MECPDCGSTLGQYQDRTVCNVCGFETFCGRIVRRRSSTGANNAVFQNSKTEASRAEAPPLARGSSRTTRGKERPGRKRYTSEANREIYSVPVREPRLTDLQVCERLDEEGYEAPPELMTPDRDYKSAYRDPELKPKLQSRISKIRRRLREEGLL